VRANTTNATRIIVAALTRTLGCAASATLLCASSCADFTSPGRASLPRSVLFLGNSLTEANDLPGLVGALVDSARLPPIEIGTVVQPGASLLDLWKGDAPSMIDRGWDVVIMQQGPTSTASGRV
jgi:hypothetical protein